VHEKDVPDGADKRHHGAPPALGRRPEIVEGSARPVAYRREIAVGALA